jgi:hypothetical protein
MLQSRSPSLISHRGLLAAAAALSGAGCNGDDSCGPGGAPDSGLVASSDMVSLTYGGLTSLLGNDCPAPDAPAGVISLSIEGRQAGDPLGLVTFCIPRPDLLMEGDRSIGTSLSNADVRIIDLRGNAEGCAFALDTTRLPTGAVQATGVCANGDSPDGFALSFDAAVDSVAVTLRGRVAVARRE